MFDDLNQCTFTGRLGADVETRSFQNGGKVANFRIAVSKSWKDRNSGERKEKTEWVSVSVFNEGLAGLCERFLRKGSRVLVKGRWQTRKWVDQSGNDRFSTECVVQDFGDTVLSLDGKHEGGDARSNTRRHDEPRQQSSQFGSGDGWSTSDFDDSLDDDIPFIIASFGAEIARRRVL